MREVSTVLKIVQNNVPFLDFSGNMDSPLSKHVHKFFSFFSSLVRKIYFRITIFSIRVFLLGTLNNHVTEREGRRSSFIPPLPTHEHSEIYLQVCMWDDYHIFLIAPRVFTRLLLDEIYHLIELSLDWLVFWR